MFKQLGIIADAQSKEFYDDLLNAILTYGIKVENCSFLVFNSDKRNDFTDKYSRFGSKDLVGVVQLMRNS